MDYVERVKDAFDKQFGSELSLKIDIEHNGYGIVISYKEIPSCYISITLSNNLGYIDMVTVSIQKKGFGSKLVLAGIFVIKELGAKYLEAHITHIGVLKILEKTYGRNKMQLYKKSLSGRGAAISYEEAEQVVDKGGFILFVKI